ncbi:MAG TPA: 16S rRNA processing protein RimM [candidate division Zixibacteria bacterium]|nr:16S rRNA processing protein RimM [candidate division Zixibacteria bacterium]
MSDDRVAIAYINKAWGVKGEVIAEPLTEFPQRFKQLKNVTVSTARLDLELKVEWTKKHSGKIVFKFEEINDRDEAQRLRNSYIEVEKSEVFKLPEGNYYQFELIGLEVEDSVQGYLGRIDDVWEYPTNDILVIRSDRGRLLIPAIKEIVRKVDLKNNKLEVTLLPGMEFEAE